MIEGSRTSNSTKNIKFGLINKITAMILSFVSRRLFIDFIGIEYLGINSLFAEILGMLSLADLGFGTAMAYSFYRPIADKDNGKISALVNFYKKIYNYIALAISILGVAIIPFLHVLIRTDMEISNLTLYYLVFLCNTVVSYLFVYKSTIISASQKNYIVLKYQMWINFIQVIIQVGITVVTGSYLIYISVSILTTLLNNIVISRKANELYPEIKERRDLTKEEKKNIYSNLKSVFLYKLAGSLLNGTSNTLISIICGTIYVGYYSNYNTIILNINAFIVIIFASLTSSIGNLIVKEDKQKRYSIFRMMQMASFTIATFCIVCLYHLTNDFIVLWLHTSEYLLDDFSLVAILINFYLAITLQPLWSYREATGLYRKTRYIMVLAAIVNLVVAIFLGRLFGLGGIIFASFIAKMTTYVWFEPKLLFNEYFEKSVLSYYVEHIVNALLTLICIVLSHSLVKNIDSLNLFNWFLKAFISTGVVIIFVIIRYSWTEEFKFLRNKLRDIVKKT